MGGECTTAVQDDKCVRETDTSLTEPRGRISSAKGKGEGRAGRQLLSSEMKGCLQTFQRAQRHEFVVRGTQARGSACAQAQV